MIYIVVGRIDVFHDALANRLLPWARDKARRFEKPGAAMRHQPIPQDRRVDAAPAEVADFRKSLPVRRHISNVKLDISAIAIVMDIRPEFRNLGKVLGCLRMGIDELSVSPAFVLKVRNAVRNIDLRCVFQQLPEQV